MNKLDRDPALLHDMVTFARRAERRIAGRTIADLLADDQLVGSALILDLFVIGEAANHVSSELQAAYPEIAWRKIIGLRNLMAHEYMNIDYAILWRITTEDVPPLITQLEAILAQYPPTDAP